ncbi:MAG: lipid hydroperoxide peroxidase [Legionella sp.]|nr:MAG: lipid hydroperoxide peroxidase [Legionella sp.]
MGTIYLKEQRLRTYGELPEIGSEAPDFVATKVDLSTCSLADFKNRAVLINVYPSIDTKVCFDSVKKFQEAAVINHDVAVLCISMDLPFALKRVLQGENLKSITFLSDFRNREFGDLFGVTIVDGPLAGLLARAIIVLDSNHRVIYHELVADVSNPPNYQAALDRLLTQ